MKLIIDDAVYAKQAIFGSFGQITAIPGRQIDKNTVSKADILIVRSRTKVDEALLAGSSVRFVASTVAGLEHIDQDYLNASGIGFFSAQGCNAMAVAEFVISACVNLAADFGFDLANKTLGIVGVGNVGSALAAKAKLMGIKTLLNDPPRQICQNRSDFVDLETALGADIISFHTPLTQTGKHPSFQLLAAHNFHHINQDSIIFNTARGGVIDESIWQKTKTLANVIDCWENEPNINQALQNNAYWATPHIAGHSVDAKFMGSFMAYQALCRYLGVSQNPAIAASINLPKTVIKETNLKDTLNKIYPFYEDDMAIKKGANFEDYRRHYPKRFEWHHFDSKISLPIL